MYKLSYCRLDIKMNQTGIDNFILCVSVVLEEIVPNIGREYKRGNGFICQQ